ncbi:SDR family NAD(P)-dependent oxidoreductase, partial [Lacticaseibacillus rhamnosus]
MAREFEAHVDARGGRAWAGECRVGDEAAVTAVFQQATAALGPIDILVNNAGVTRDRIEIETEWRDRPFILIDTGGYVRDAEGIEALVSEQAARAATEADVILLVCDAPIGPQAEDVESDPAGTVGSHVGPFLRHLNLQTAVGARPHRSTCRDREVGSDLPANPRKERRREVHAADPPQPQLHGPPTGADG